MNYMKQVAEILGLEWDDDKDESEEFKIVNLSDTYKLSLDCGLLRVNEKKPLINALLFMQLIKGDYQIQKLPWKPNMNEHYYTVDLINTHQPYSQSFWKGNENDMHRIKHGLVFRTKEEAISRTQEILKMLEVQNI